MKNNEHGRSMIEMLGVLAIIGVLSLAGVSGYQKAMAKHKINKTVNQMAQIVNNTRTAFLNQHAKYPYAIFGPTKNDGKTQTAMKQAVALHIFPDEMIQDSQTPKIYNAYKGEVYIISEDEGETFEVVFEDLPRDASVAIGTMDWGTSDVTGLQELLINEDDESSAQSVSSD